MDPFSSGDPFGADNPFSKSTTRKSDDDYGYKGTDTASEKQQPQQQQPTAPPATSHFVDPFAPQPPPPAAPQQLEEETSQVDQKEGERHSPLDDSLARNSPVGSPCVSDLPAPGSSSLFSSKLHFFYPDTPVPIEEWKEQAVDEGRRLGKIPPEEKHQRALKYISTYGITADPDVLHAAQKTEAGIDALCQHLRLSPTGTPYRDRCRVEAVGAKRHGGKGIELGFWAYKFKVYTNLPQYLDQPHFDGQKDDTYHVYKSVLTILTTERRYKDFVWLRSCLQLEHPGAIIPPIPEKTIQSIKEKVGGKGDACMEGDLSEIGKDKGQWQPDSEVQNCNLCQVKFGLVVRKHHCRHCLRIFCDSCCPKPSGAKRFCKECQDLKGLGEMLMKNPDVAFRIRGLQFFLSCCVTGPLAESPSLQFFLEAPPAVFSAQKDTRLKELTAKAQAYDKSVGEAAKEKINGAKDWWSREVTGPNASDTNTLTPRTLKRRGVASQFQHYAAGLTTVRVGLFRNLFDALSRKKSTIPDLVQFMDDSHLRALRSATEHTDNALCEFTNRSKELLFNMIVDLSFMIGLFNSVLKTMGDIDRLALARRSVMGKHEKLSQLNDKLDQCEARMALELPWLRKVYAAMMRKFFDDWWQYERGRDTIEYNWTLLDKQIDSLKDPVF
eukprot:Sspe_Gene.3532::Locus_1171_Transcript_2_2_Confidence_0.750_Length_2105::g.3532::m.3532